MGGGLADLDCDYIYFCLCNYLAIGHLQIPFSVDRGRHCDVGWTALLAALQEPKSKEGPGQLGGQVEEKPREPGGSKQTHLYIEVSPSQ